MPRAPLTKRGPTSRRAEEGLGRLSTILSRMTEASRLEQSLSAAQRESFDAAAVVRGCVEGYRLAYASRTFELAVPAEKVLATGSADLLAQMLDKLVENAVDFAAVANTDPHFLGIDARLRVENLGRRCPMPSAIPCLTRWSRCAAIAQAARRIWDWDCTSRA